MIRNDIKLQNNHDGTFDWQFDLQDVHEVAGNERLLNNIIHAISLRPYELAQELYKFNGCHAWDYINENRTEHVTTLLIENMKQEIKNIDGITEAELNVDESKSYISFIDAVILKEDGTEVILDDF